MIRFFQKPKKQKKSIYVIIIALLITWIGYGFFSVNNIEEPTFTVIDRKEFYEIRLYEPQVIAKATVSGESQRQAMNSAFRMIGGYIFGDNAEEESIAMTIPVSVEEKNDYTMSFVMPKEYSLETLPLPKNKEVILEELPAKTYAVHRFSGFNFESRFDRRAERLLQLLNEEQVEIVSENAIYSYYNPPWTPPFMNRNEVWIEVN